MLRCAVVPPPRFGLRYGFKGTYTTDRPEVIWIFANFMELTTYLQNLVMLIGFGIAIDYSLLVVYRYRDSEEIRRVLRPGGRAIVHHGNTLSELGWRKFVADAERERRALPSAGRFPAMTPDLMRTLIERAGLVLVRSEEAIVRRDAIALITKPA